jgi:hypothetical protein
MIFPFVNSQPPESGFFESTLEDREAVYATPKARFLPQW